MGLPQLIDPLDYMRTHKTLVGNLKGAEMVRLSEVVSETPGEVAFNLSFERDEEGRCVIHCRVVTILKLICQRCNETMDLTVNTDSTLCVIADGAEAQQLPKAYEPLVTHGESVVVQEMIEEELLLAIPMVPRHENDHCAVKMNGKA